LSSGFVGALGHLLLLECGSEPLDPTCKTAIGKRASQPGWRRDEYVIVAAWLQPRCREIASAKATT
jgi:hypothetical protein